MQITIKKPCMSLAAVLAIAAAGTSRAATVEFSLSGFGSNLPAEYFVWDVHSYGSGLSTATQTAYASTDAHLGRLLDAYSPALNAAVISGTVYTSAKIDYCKPNCLAPTASSSILLSHVMLSSYALDSGVIPSEAIGLNFSSMTVSYTGSDPQKGAYPWSVFMPRTLPVGLGDVYDFILSYDGGTIEDRLDGPASIYGLNMPDTISGPSAVPVPAAVWLLGSALGALRWMKRKSK